MLHTKALRGAGEIGAVKNRHCSWPKDRSSIPSMHGSQLTAHSKPGTPAPEHPMLSSGAQKC